MNAKSVITAAAFVALVAVPRVARAQQGREDLYQFRVPIHLTQLPPDLAVIVLRCKAGPSMNMSTTKVSVQEHELPIAGAHLDTTVVTQFKVVVPLRDVNSPGDYTCQLFGRRSTDGPSSYNGLGPNEQFAAFRLTPALLPIAKRFNW